LAVNFRKAQAREQKFRQAKSEQQKLLNAAKNEKAQEESRSQKLESEFEAIETVLKGKEIPLPDGHMFHDKDGNARHDIRIRWWDRSANTYALAFLGPESARTHIPDDEIKGDHLIEYTHEEPPVFLGHYWMEGEPKPLAANIACMDYSVAKEGGKLAAYRWDGEQELSREKFVAVDRIDS